PHDPGHPLRGDEMNQATLIEKGYIAIKDGKVLQVAAGKPESELIGPATQRLDYRGKFAAPGLIDCHTHLVYGGSRENEFAQKLNGVPYLDILAAGGGILSTVEATRQASFDELYQKTAGLLEE